MSPYLSHNFKHKNLMHHCDTEAVFPDICKEPETLPLSLDPFTVTTSTGFLPFRNPLVDLPAPFLPLMRLLDQMPVVKEDGQAGLMATYQLGQSIDNGTLPDLSCEIDALVASDGKPDLSAITAAYRDYSFLASAYLLEPCWENWNNNNIKGYGLGREVLPKCIALPLAKVAKQLDVPPFLSYAAGYALWNYRFVDPSVGTTDYGNLRLIRAFERGLDPLSSEAGFILTHVDMVKHSHGLVNGTVRLLDAVAVDAGASRVAESFEILLETMRIIEDSMEAMWAHSKPKDYISYRTFIFGITNQSMFPNGVVYDGVNDNHPMHFRGESGANDSIIPLLDGLLQIPMPPNPLTEILKDFRNYRPKPHREFLTYVRQRADDLNVKAYCCGDVETTVLYLRLLEHVRSFRWRHWLFAREYIIRRSSHPTATGGSPIVTWLPNQLFAVMELMRQVWESVSNEDKSRQTKHVVEMMGNVYDQHDKLQKEVDRWCQERGV